MLTSIDVKFIFDSACLSASLGDKGLFSLANIFQIADPELRCRPSSCLLAVLATFLGNSLPYFFLVKRVKCSSILYSLPKQLNLVLRSSRVTVQ